MKRCSVLLVALLMVITMLPGTALAEEELITLRVMGPSATLTAGSEQMTFDEWMHSGSPLVNAFNEALASYGIALELDLIPSDQYQVVCQTRLAVGLDADWMVITPLDVQTRYQLVDQGKLLPINQIWEQYSEGTAKDFFTAGDGQQEMKQFALEDGNLYWLTHVTRGEYEGEAKGATMSFMLRKDWVDRLGLEMPTTTDELYDILVAFQENDMNGNGMADEVVSLDLSRFQNGIAQWFGIGPELTYINLETGNVETPWQNPNIRAYLEFMKKLVDAGLVDTSDQGSQKQAENKISAQFSWTTDTWTEATVTVGEGEDHACFVPVLCSAVDGVEPHALLQGGLMMGSDAFAVTNVCEHPEAIGALLDFVTSDEYLTLTEYGLLDYTYTEDENGVRTKITGDSFEQQYMSSRSAPWISILPRREMVDRAAEVHAVLNAAGDDAAYLEDLEAKEAMGYALLSADYVFPHETTPNFAVETPEETEEIAEISTDLTTYSEELLTQLVLGTQSMEDWDTYMADLERLGLNEYVAIHQARYDRTK